MTALPVELRELIGHPLAAKTLGTTGADGIPVLARRDSLEALDADTLAFAEEFDNSATSKDLVRAIWGELRVAVLVSEGGRAWHIQARPWKCLVTGPLFKRFLLEARARDGGDADIAAVWLLKAEEVREDSPTVSRARQQALRPWAGAHLDRESLVLRVEGPGVARGIALPVADAGRR